MSLIRWWPLTTDLNDKLSVASLDTSSKLFEDGKIGKALVLQSVEAFVPNPFVGLNDWSISFWVMNTGSSDWNDFLCFSGNKARIEVHNDNKSWTWFCDNTTSGAVFTSGTAISHSMSAYTWYHVTIVKNGANAKFYLNGSCVLEQNVATNFTSDSASMYFNSRIGTQYANGRYNDIRCYNHALSKKEVQELSFGLMIHYKLNELLYQPVEYLESDGTSWIDTECYAHPDNIRIETQFMYTANSSHGSIYGCQDQQNLILRREAAKSYAMCFYPPSVQVSSTINLNQVYQSTLNYTKLGSSYVYTINFNNNRYEGTNSGPLPTTMYISLFNTTHVKNGQYGSQAVAGIAAKARIYYFRLWNNGELVRNMIPCIRRNDRVPGFYDQVTGRFFENKGTGTFIYPAPSAVIADSSGLNNHGTSYNVSYTANSRTGSNDATFNGSGSYITVPNAKPLLANDDYTIAFWCKFDEDASSTRDILFGNYDNTSTNSFNIERLENVLRIYYGQDTPGKITAVTLPKNQWIHLAIIRRGGRISVWKNGIHVYDEAVSFPQLGNKGKTYYIGSDIRSGATRLKGMLSDFRIYTTALDRDVSSDGSVSSNIAALYHTSLAINRSGQIFSNAVNEGQSKFQTTRLGILNCNELNETPILPPQYTPYQSAATNNAIDTGIIPNQDTCIDIIFTPTSYNSYQSFIYGGGGSDFQTRAYELYTWEGHFQFNYNNSTVNIDPIAPVSTMTHVIHNKNNIRITQNDTTITATLAASNFTADVPLTFGAINRTTGISMSESQIFFHRIIIHNGEQLQRYYVPCFDGNQPGFYDFVTRSFTGNGEATCVNGNAPEDNVGTNSTGSLYCTEFNEI